MTRISLGGLAAGRGKHTLTIFSDSSRVHAGPPGGDSNFSNMSRFLPFYTPELEAKPGVELLM